MTSMTVHHAVIIGMLSIISTISTAQQECFNGQVRKLHSDLLEYCYNGEWRLVYYSASQWSTNMTRAVCAQLGYQDFFGLVRGGSQSGAGKFVTLKECNEPGLTGCIETPSDSCTECSPVFLQCTAANCDDGEIRLVGGRDTDRQGRVEVCASQRWRTVCTGSQEVAGAVCLQMGYIFEGGTVAPPNSFPPGAFPEYRLDCTHLSNGAWHCSPVEQQCDSFVELGVVCKNYENLYDECSTNCTLSRLSVTITQSPTTKQAVCANNSTVAVTTPMACNSTTSIVGIGVLVALLLAVSVGWMVSCVILLKRGQIVHKQHVDAGTISTRSNQSYTQQDINTQLYAEATPPDTTYSRLNRSDKQTEEIATYNYADPNQIRVERSQATNPPPVSGEAIVREEEFYIAEDHTYAAVNKKAKKKKKPKNAESDAEGESEAPPPFVSTLAEV
ncbi:neurotrypsin-like isoform X3 [Halichondria panicea]|uniref:neurotrypsin-like isoform X3 n=1 Tax=Halichondria panicea TaxID=6063 RepID=UPI00312B4CA4